MYVPTASPPPRQNHRKYELWAYCVSNKPDFYDNFESVKIIGKIGPKTNFFAKN
jgi:hypothetical protein